MVFIFIYIHLNVKKIHYFLGAGFAANLNLNSGYCWISFHLEIFLLLFAGFISYNNCWKSRVLCLDKQKLESQREICTNSHICNWSVFIYWASPSTCYSFSCMFIDFYKQAVHVFFFLSFSQKSTCFFIVQHFLNVILTPFKNWSIADFAVAEWSESCC